MGCLVDWAFDFYPAVVGSWVNFYAGPKFGQMVETSKQKMSMPPP